MVYAASDSLRYFYDKVNRVTNVVDSIAGSTKLTYDTLDRMTQVLDINGTLTYAYNDLGLRTNMSVAGQNTVAYFYDPATRLTNVVQGTFTGSLGYDDDGRRTKLVLPNGIGVLYSYDVASRLTSIVYQASSTNYIAYGYDSAGNRASQASALSAYFLPSAISNSNYDAANHQLAFGSYNILYDLDGNVTNVINGTTTNTLLWSARNQLTNMLGAVTATFGYDGVGRRITRTIGSATEKYLYDGLDIIQQLNNAGTVGANYFRGLAIDEPWQRIDVGSANTNRIYLVDALASAVALADTNKVVQSSYTYDPFGNTTTTGAGNKNSYQFTGRENDGAGLYYYRARYYHPALERFVSEDPFEMIDGPNEYLYVKNNPSDGIDPMGLCNRNDPPPVVPWPPSRVPRPRIGGPVIDASIVVGVGGGASTIYCCDSNKQRWKATYYKWCVGPYVGASAVGGGQQGVTGANCPYGYKGWFVEAGGGIGVVGGGGAVSPDCSVGAWGVGIGLFGGVMACKYTLLDAQVVGKCCP